MISGHGGNIDQMARRLGCQPDKIIDMSSNINPLGSMPGLLSHLKQNINCVSVLPEADAQTVHQAFAQRYDLDPDAVLAGNGVTQFIYALPLVLATQQALIVGPTYADYADACQMHATPYDFYYNQSTDEFRFNPARIHEHLSGVDTVFICNPNNPTGALLPKSELMALCRKFPDINFIIDESYLPFVSQGDHESMLNANLTNVIVFHSISKIFAMPGLRIGFMIASPWIIQRFKKYWPPWCINSLAQKAVIWLMRRKDETERFIHQTVQFIQTEKERFVALLNRNANLRLFPSSTGFMLAHINGEQTAADVNELLLQRKILIRDCANFQGLSPHYFRVAFKSSSVNRVLAEILLQLSEDSSG